MNELDLLYLRFGGKQIFLKLYQIIVLHFFFVLARYAFPLQIIIMCDVVNSVPSGGVSLSGKVVDKHRCQVLPTTTYQLKPLIAASNRSYEKLRSLGQAPP